jgi:hypothetical protein
LANGHKRLAASATERWTTCHGSVAAEAAVPQKFKESSGAAMMGTAAHAVGERCIQEGIKDASYFKKYVVQLPPEGDNSDPDFTEPAWFPPKNKRVDAKAKKLKRAFEVNDKMVDGVNVYLGEIEYQRDQLGDDRVEGSEVRVDMSWLDEDLGGTTDWYAVQPFGLLVLVDYKNGFWPVEVEGNKQLMHYAVGLVHLHPDCEEVEIVIVQPNAQHEDGPVRRWRTTAAAIRAFGQFLKDSADATRDPNAKRVAGKHCSFCDATVGCEENMSLAAEKAGLDFAGIPDELDVPSDANSNWDPVRIARYLEWIPFIDARNRAVEAHAQRAAEAGTPIPGNKLVRKKTNRVYTIDEEDVIEKARKLGATDDDLFTERKLKGPAQLEKLGDTKEAKAKFKALVKEIADKPEGGLTLAPESDPRPAVQIGATNDFDDVED